MFHDWPLEARLLPGAFRLYAELRTAGLTADEAFHAAVIRHENLFKKFAVRG